jgi:hypothetical protein
MKVKKTLKAERGNVRRKQNSPFPVTAHDILTFAVACVEENSSPLNWQDVSNLFYELETAFDQNFHHVDMSKITGRDELSIQNNVDAILRTKQSKLAAALLESDSELAQRYAAILRGVEKPLGLSEAEKRTAFLQEIERRVPNPKTKKKTEKNIDQTALIAAVNSALFFSRVNPDKKQKASGELVEKFQELRHKCETNRATWFAIAQWEIETARKTPDKVKWMRRSVAKSHYDRAVRGEPFTQKEIKTHVAALERRYRRAVEQAKRPPAKK